MFFEIEPRKDSIAVVKVHSALLHANSLAPLESIISKLRQQGKHLVVLDCGKISRASISGTVSLVELVSRQHAVPIVICKLPECVIKRLSAANMEQAFDHYNSLNDILEVPAYRAYQLRGLRALVLSAGRGTRLAPLTDTTPKPMLDIVGKPVLIHILDYLESFGIQGVLLNPGYLAPKIHRYLSNHPRNTQSVFFFNEGKCRYGTWKARPLGSASTLAQLQLNHNAFDTDFLVLCGDALIDADLGEMLLQHKKNDADVTIAALKVTPENTHKYGMMDVDESGRVLRFEEKPKLGMTNSTLANTGIYIFNPRILKLIKDLPDQDIGADLLPEIVRSGGKINVYTQPFSWTDIGCARDYFTAATAVLDGTISNATPEGKNLQAKQWEADGASVSRWAKITGPCYIGAGAKISAGAKIVGPAIIGEGAVISGGSLVQKSLIMPGTHVQKGAIVDGQITHANWSVTIKLADGSPQENPPLEYVDSVENPSAIDELNYKQIIKL